jgi:hypothetical protein
MGFVRPEDESIARDDFSRALSVTNVSFARNDQIKLPLR